MLTIERIFGPEALEELFAIPLTPFERKIGDLLLEVYSESAFPKPSGHDPLPAHYRKIKVDV